MNLMRPYLDKGIKLYRVGTGTTGTARNRKWIPAKVNNTLLKNKDDSIVKHNGPLMTMKLRERKYVKICPPHTACL
jgi:hypothetical protein